MRRVRARVALLLSLSIVSGFAAVASATPQLIDLGHLPPNGSIASNTSFAAAISADGHVVVGASSGQAFRWTEATGMVGLGNLSASPTSVSEASAVSADGSVVVGSANSSALGFRWTAATGMVSLGNSLLKDVSGDGSVIVGNAALASAGRLGARWTEATGWQQLGSLVPGNNTSAAEGISTDGDTIVGWARSPNTTAINHEGFRWTEGAGMSGIGDLPGGAFSSEGLDVSADGSVVVGAGAANFGSIPIRWTVDDGIVALIERGFFDAEPVNGAANAVSADGSVVVGDVRAGSGPNVPRRAFMWDEAHGFRLLDQVLVDLGIDASAFELERALGISADGTHIVGSGSNGVAWLLIIPEPGTAALLYAGLAGLGFRNRRS